MATTTYEPIESKVLGSATTSVIFSNIPQTYTDLILVCDGALSGSGVKLINFNGSGSSYSCTSLVGTGSATASSSYTDPYIDVWNSSTNRYTNTVQINNYSNSTTFKTYLARQDASSTATEAIIGTWRNTAAITSLTITTSGNNLTAGSTFVLYGIANADVATEIKAIGGVITYDSTYYYHTFGASGTFTPKQSLTADYLVVAGGGGGGAGDAGGGGAGGYRTSIGGSALSLTAQAYTVTIGAGGTAGSWIGSSFTQPSNGTDSVFSTITSTGGGRGGSLVDGANLNAGGNGGSGGGGGRPGTSTDAGTGNTPSTSPSQGNNGGAGSGAPNYTGGGGGGAGSAGSGSTAGSGASNSISGSAVTYATGGTGLAIYSGGTAATANTGNGGNGAGKGGSGIVIIRYTKA